MNKREFIVELWKKVDELCIQCHVSCPKCLDMKKLWKYIDEVPVIMACYHCCEDGISPIQMVDTDFYGTIGKSVNPVPIFELRDDLPGARIEILQGLLEESMKERSEKISKRLEVFADGSVIHHFGEPKMKEISRTVKHNRLSIEIRQFLQYIVVELYSLPWMKKLDIPIHFTWTDICTQGYSCVIFEDENTYPIYFFMTLHAYNYMNWFRIIDTCGIVSDDVHVYVKSYALYPKNDTALELCEKIKREHGSIQ